MVSTIIQFIQDQVEKSGVGGFETARKVNENKLSACQRPESVRNNRILANLESPRGQAILI